MSEPVDPVPLDEAVADRSSVGAALDNIAVILATISGLGGLFNPGVAATGELAGKLLRVISAGVKAHEAITGQPLDMSKLHHIDLVE